MEPQVPGKRRFRLLLAGTAMLVFLKIFALAPVQLEESRNVVLTDPQKLIEWVSGEEKGGARPSLATGVPSGKIPDYSVDQFDFVSSREGVHDWRLQAARAHLFNREKVVHSLSVKAFLFDKDGNATVVTGKEAKYFMNDRDLEIFGNVVAVFPDGFELRSEYLKYMPRAGRVHIPVAYATKGQGVDHDRRVTFVSQGLDFLMSEGRITLPASVRLTLAKAPHAKPAARSASDGEGSVTIDSDKCVIHRNASRAEFTMGRTRPITDRFVKVTQPSLFVKSRRAELRYGDFSEVIHYMTAFEDVLIQETGKVSSLRYATAGRADFDALKNRIILSEFPQVYQDNDTVVGDLVVLDRDTDIVEVRNSNAFTHSH